MLKQQDNKVLQELKAIRVLLEQSNKADRPMNIEEASRFLGLSVSYIYTLCNKKKIGHYKPNGKKIYFSRQDLLDFILRNKVSSDSQINDKALAYLNRSG